MMEIKSWMEQIIQSPARYAIPVMTHPVAVLLVFPPEKVKKRGCACGICNNRTCIYRNKKPPLKQLLS